MFNPADIKKDFPIFHIYPDLVFADNASTSQKPNLVIDNITLAYKTSNANVHRAIYNLGVKADEIFAQTKINIVDHFGFPLSEYGVVYTSGTTDGINKLSRAIEFNVKSGDNIVVSEMEHHSNYLPWLELCKRNGIELRIGAITKNGDLDIDHILSIMDQNTKVVSLIHISNTLGTINDLMPIAEKSKNLNSVFIIDAAQSATFYGQDLKELEPDALVFSGHKMFGPTGIGAILGKKKFLESLPPMSYGGGMVQEVNTNSAIYHPGISRHEAGTPPIIQIAGLSAAIDYLRNLDSEECVSHIKKLAVKLRNGLFNRAQILGRPDQYTGIVSCLFDEIHPHDAATFLNSKNIAVRAGHHCTQLIMKKYETLASVRFSFSIYNTEDDIDKILNAVDDMKTYFE